MFSSWIEFVGVVERVIAISVSFLVVKMMWTTVRRKDNGYRKEKQYLFWISLCGLLLFFPGMLGLLFPSTFHQHDIFVMNSTLSMVLAILWYRVLTMRVSHNKLRKEQATWNG